MPPSMWPLAKSRFQLGAAGPSPSFAGLYRYESLHQRHRSSSRHALIQRRRAGLSAVFLRVRDRREWSWAGSTTLGVTDMATGTVKFFNTTKGFGFIAPEGGSKDVFVHISALERSGMRSLNEGQKVSFDLEKDRQGRE